MLKQIKAVVFDLDGVLRIGDNAIPHADNVIKWLGQQGYKMLIVTNECRWDHNEMSEMLNDIGLSNAAELPIYTAGTAVCNYLTAKKKVKQEISVGVLGEPGLRRTLSDHSELRSSKEKYLVVGTVNKISDEHLQYADKWIKSGANVIVTCIDTADPSKQTMTMPMKLLEKVDTSTVSIETTGKPHSGIGNSILKQVMCEANEVLFIGDTMETDIQLAIQCGFKSALVLSGNVKDSDELTDYNFKPDYVIESVADLLPKTSIDV